MEMYRGRGAKPRLCLWRRFFAHSGGGPPRHWLEMNWLEMELLGEKTAHHDKSANLREDVLRRLRNIACGALLAGALLALGVSNAARAMGARPSAATAGFRTLTVLDEAGGQSYNAALWYPARKAESEITDADWLIRCARNGKMADGVFPLVLVSHHSAGSKHSLHDLAAMLAHNGCVVLCLSHSGDNYREADLAFTPELLPVRARQAKRLLDLFLTLPEWGERIDRSRIAFVGVGTGAATALALSGAPLSAQGYDAYCAGNVADDVYCSQWVRSRMRGLDDAFATPPPVWKPRALLLVAPAYGMFFEPGAAAALSCPVMVFSAGKTGGHGEKDQTDFIMAALPGRARRKTLPEFAAEDFLAECPHSFDEPTVACGGPGSAAREIREEAFLHEAAAFLTQALGGG